MRRLNVGRIGTCLVNSNLGTHRRRYSYQHVFRFISQPAASSVYLFSTPPKEVLVFVPAQGEGQISPGQQHPADPSALIRDLVYSLYATVIPRSFLAVENEYGFSCVQGQFEAPAVTAIP